jgi:hypothetical protein
MNKEMNFFACVNEEDHIRQSFYLIYALHKFRFYFDCVIVLCFVP